MPARSRAANGPIARPCSYQNLSGLPDLRDSAWVLEQQHRLVDAMVAMGFDGFRVDAIKHITERMIDNIADRPEVREQVLVRRGADRQRP